MSGRGWRARSCSRWGWRRAVRSRAAMGTTTGAVPGGRVNRRRRIVGRRRSRRCGRAQLHRRGAEPGRDRRQLRRLVRSVCAAQALRGPGRLLHRELRQHLLRAGERAAVLGRRPHAADLRRPDGRRAGRRNHLGPDRQRTRRLPERRGLDRGRPDDDPLEFELALADMAVTGDGTNVWTIGGREPHSEGGYVRVSRASAPPAPPPGPRWPKSIPSARRSLQRSGPDGKVYAIGQHAESPLPTSRPMATPVESYQPPPAAPGTRMWDPARRQSAVRHHRPRRRHRRQ